MEEKEAQKQHNPLRTLFNFWNLSYTALRSCYNQLFSSPRTSLNRFVSQSAGFTLIEILIVVGIASLLIVAYLVFGNPTLQTAKAKDAERMSDLKQLKVALDLYYDDHKCYPDSIPSDTWIENGVVYMVKVPKDPDIGTQADSGYIYQVDSTDTCPQWNVLYTGYTSRKYTDEDCALSKMSACNYTSEKACSISGEVDCGYVAAHPLTSITPPPPNGCTAQENIDREYGLSSQNDCNRVPIGTGQYCDNQCTILAQ